MAEQKSLRGWFKTILGTVAGLASGAAAMYLSPLVNGIIKPGKPLANFAVETDGLTATFHNRYSGEGWWDFGDGSPLEPATISQDSVTHTYPKAGAYPAKLIVRNYVGEEHERSVSLDVTVASQTVVQPAITALEAVPITSDRTAPATFRIVAQTTNAERCLWDFGGDKPLEVATESLARQERFITFATPGTHVIQAVALSGNNAVRRTVTVQVEQQRSDTLVAKLKVTDRGTRSEKRQQTESVPITLTKQSGSSVAIDRKVSARYGATIRDAQIAATDPAFKNLKAVISPDRRSVQLTGSLSPTSAMMQAPNPPSIPLVLTCERHSKMLAAPVEVTASVTIPGTVSLPLPPLPADGAQAQRSLVLELHSAGGQTWQQPLPSSATPLDFGNKRFAISTAANDREVRIDITAQAGNVTSRTKP